MVLLHALRAFLRARPGLAFFVFVLAASVVAGVALDPTLLRVGSPHDRAGRLLARGRTDEARAVVDDAFAKAGTLDLAIEYVDLHASTLPFRSARFVDPSAIPLPVPTGSVPRGAPVVPGTPLPGRAPDAAAALDAQTAPVLPLLDRPDLGPDVALLGAYWKEVRTSTPRLHAARVLEGADAASAREDYNYVLGLAEDEDGHPDRAAARFFREAHAQTPRAREAVKRGLSLLVDEAALDRALADPVVRAYAPAGIRFDAAVRRKDVREAARSILGASFPTPSPATGALAAITALGWAIFLARLAGFDPKWKLVLFAGAFVLGALSIVPTDLFIALEERFLHLEETHDPVRDALFFVCGVGFREELAKVLLFLPLVPFLRPRARAKSARDPGHLLDATIAGAFVGLGFAAIENLHYLAHGDLSTGMARFLTANFFHLATTGLVAPQIVRAFDEGERRVPDLSRTFLLVVVMHGAYDFLLSGGLGSGGSYFGMTVFVLLGRRFIAAVLEHRRRTPRGPRALDTFYRALACVVGASYLYASAEAGPATAALACGVGLLGIAILVWVFTYELRDV